MILILVLLLTVILILLMVRIRVLLLVMLMLMLVELRVVLPAATTNPAAIHVVWRALVMILLLPNSLVLHLEALVANLVAVHLFNSTLGGFRRVIRDKAKSLGFARVPIDIHLGRYDIPERSEGRD